MGAFGALGSFLSPLRCDCPLSSLLFIIFVLFTSTVCPEGARSLRHALSSIGDVLRRRRSQVAHIHGEVVRPASSMTCINELEYLVVYV